MINYVRDNGMDRLPEKCYREIEVVRKMTETLAKRGPDQSNVWTDTHVAFGHKRLTVVDPVAAVSQC